MTTADGAADLIDVLALRTGLDFSGPHQERMQSALEHARRDAGASDHADLVARAAQDPETYAGLIDRLTVGETYFFREPAQIDLVRALARGWSEQPAPRRVWSAGCATGEEPYTLAIVLDEAGVLEHTEIAATDLSRHAVDRARLGSYGKWSLRRCDADVRRRYFHERAGRHELHQRFVDAVRFDVRSLMDGPPARGAYDLVLCRNVLIYFHGEALQQAAATLRDALRPGGTLIMGSSDPGLRVDGLGLVRSQHGLQYRRTTGAASVPAAGDARPAAALRTPAADTPDPAVPPRKRRRAPEVTPAAPPAPDVPEDLDEAVSSLLAAGDTAGAERLVAAALSERPVDAGLRMLAATLDLHADRTDEAAKAATAAVYLDPEMVVAHLLLGRIELHRGNQTAARRSLLAALELLAGVEPTAEVPGSGEQAGSVAAATAELLEATVGPR